MNNFRKFLNLYCPELNQVQRMKLEKEVEKLIVEASKCSGCGKHTDYCDNCERLLQT